MHGPERRSADGEANHVQHFVPRSAARCQRGARIGRANARTMSQPKIVVTPAGPYLVTGLGIEVQSMEPLPGGESWEWRSDRTIAAGEKFALCRCGASTTKPFCDGTHTTTAWEPAETASRATYAERAKTIAGPTMTLHDDESLCAYARFCDNHGKIWTLIEQTDDPTAREFVTHEETRCPSGRLVVVDNATGSTIEPEFEPSIVLAEDPAKNCSGPIWVRGGVPVESQDGTPYETRNRVTLCRCGKSSNKPFCDGTHVDVAFDDGLR
jgi:CDGSH-type Zn-finger protein